MGALIAPLLRGLSWLLSKKLGLFFAFALSWLGLSFVTTNYVVQPAIDALIGYATGSMGGGTGEYWAMGMAWMGVLNFDRALTMICSAYAVRAALWSGHVRIVKKLLPPGG